MRGESTRIYSTGFCGIDIHSLHRVPATRFYFVTRLVPAPGSISFRECVNTLFPPVSVVFLCLLTQCIARRFIGDALRRLLNDSVRLVTGWRHAVGLGRWPWRFRSRMATHVCNASQ